MSADQKPVQGGGGKLIEEEMLTLKVGEAAILLNDRWLGWETPFIATETTTDISILWKFHPDRATVRHEVELIKQS